jgi:hypothetical protein
LTAAKLFAIKELGKIKKWTKKKCFSVPRLYTTAPTFDLEHGSDMKSPVSPTINLSVRSTSKDRVYRR